MAAPDAHGAAMEESWAKLAQMDLQLVAANSGAELAQGTSILRIRVMDEDCAVDVSSRMVSCAGSEQGSDQHLRILILHYLLGAGDAPLANRPATYREFEGGALYYSAFKARTIDPIVREFGQRPDMLKKAGDAIRAEPVKSGSVAFKVLFFPKLPVTVVMWLGDEEVPASANMLFDENAGKIMPTEDLAVLGGELVNRLIALAKG